MRLPRLVWSSSSETRYLRIWPLYLLAAPAAVAVWSGWVGLGEMTGFGKVYPLPGIADKFSINSAITLPIGVEAYAAYALGAWLTRRPLGATTRAFARASAVGALILGGCGQIAYHLITTLQTPHKDQAGNPLPLQAPWWITTIVACLPVLVLGMGATLAHLIHRDARTDEDATKPSQIGTVTGPLEDAAEDALAVLKSRSYMVGFGKLRASIPALHGHQVELPEVAYSTNNATVVPATMPPNNATEKAIDYATSKPPVEGGILNGSRVAFSSDYATQESHRPEVEKATVEEPTTPPAEPSKPAAQSSAKKRQRPRRGRRPNATTLDKTRELYNQMRRSGVTPTDRGLEKAAKDAGLDIGRTACKRIIADARTARRVVSDLAREDEAGQDSTTA
jgi:hypothetical protein